MRINISMIKILIPTIGIIRVVVIFMMIIAKIEKKIAREATVTLSNVYTAKEILENGKHIKSILNLSFTFTFSLGKKKKRKKKDHL